MKDKRCRDIRKTLHGILDGEICKACELSAREIVNLRTGKGKRRPEEGTALFVTFYKDHQTIQIESPLLNAQE